MTAFRQNFYRRIQICILLVGSALGDDYCSDSNLPVWVEAKKDYKGCTWLTKDANQHYGYGCQDPDVETHCPVKCNGGCGTCVDSVMTFQFINKNNNKMDLKCEDVAVKLHLCKDSKISKTCPKTCGACPSSRTTSFLGTCSDSNLKAWVPDEEDWLGCNWLVTNQGCAKNKNWKHCRDQCNRCGTCKDSAMKFQFINKNNNKQELTCEDVKLKLHLCKDSKISKTCPKTCDACPSVTEYIMEASSSITAPAVFDDETSVQSQALTWLLANENLEAYSSERLLQRWVLAVFYYTTSGERWTFNNGWLTDSDECTWHSGFSPSCDSEGLFAKLALDSNNVLGTLPPELGLLSNSLEYIYINSNVARDGGTIPSEFGMLTKLTRLTLSYHALSGSIPSEIGNLESLQTLSLEGNHLSSEIPKELGNLENLLFLQLQSNQISSEIPTELGNLSQLEGVDLSSNNLSGKVPDALCAIVATNDATFLADCKTEITCPCCTVCYD